MQHRDGGARAAEPLAAGIDQASSLTLPCRRTPRLPAPILPSSPLQVRGTKAGVVRELAALLGGLTGVGELTAAQLRQGLACLRGGHYCLGLFAAGGEQLVLALVPEAPSKRGSHDVQQCSVAVHLL